MRLLLALVLIAWSIKVFSQENFIEGYVINNNLDTSRGYIDYDAKKHFICRFKKFGTDSVINFKPFDIIGYRFLNDKYFVSKKIIIRKSYNKNQEVSYNINEPLSDRYITKTWYDDEGYLDLNVFLEYLIEGKMKIFYFNNNGVNCYFAENDRDTLIDLTQESVKVYENGQIFSEIVTETYKNKLRALTQDFPELKNDLNITELNHKNLIKISKDYHNYVCHDNKCIVYEREITPPKLKLTVYGGIGFSATSKLTLRPYGDLWSYGVSKTPVFYDFSSFLFGIDLNIEQLLPTWENTSLTLGLYLFDNSYRYSYKKELQLKSGFYQIVEIKSTYKIKSVCINLGITRKFYSGFNGPYYKIGITQLRPISEEYTEAPVTYSRLGVNSLNQTPLGLLVAIGYRKHLQNGKQNVKIELQHIQFLNIQLNTNLLVGIEF
jgi:hypothetical protein